MTCAVCGRPLVGTQVVGRWFVWVHATPEPADFPHLAQPVRAARHG